MPQNLHDLLQQDEPSALPRIERALLSQDDLSADQEAVLSALVWQRCTGGAAGLLGCVLHQDCAKLIDNLPNQLARIGAADASIATKELRNAIPLDDGQIRGGVADWIDTQPDIVKKAHELDDGLHELDQTIWDFMKDPSTDIPDLEILTRTESLVSSVVGLFRSKQRRILSGW
ncbi:hypothetical protein [Jannaschia seohaensis]|uniref:hypothetical protein n=1 Tax=Jannaschia seohaensis TaxID=475081 RepID=UPI0011B244A6|nr:hypothetical protein [Jannaschia seohaensis]